MKKLLLLIALMFMAGSSFANPLSAYPAPPAGGEDSFVVAPIGAFEFNPRTPNNYGLAISESIGLFEPASDIFSGNTSFIFG